MELKQYISPLIKWWWLVLASTLIAALSSLYAVSRQPDLYQARATLMLGQAINNPNPTGSEFLLSQQLGQAYVSMASREPVRRGTMSALGLEWLPDYSVSQVADSQLIEIKVNDTNPERAMVVANELANQIISRSPTSAREQEEQERVAFVQAQLDDLETQIEVTTQEISAKQAELGDLFSARQIADAQSQIAALDNKLRSLQTNYIDLLYTTQQGAINSLSVFETAEVPIDPVGPNRLGTVLTAAAIGFVLGAMAAYLLEYLDDTVKIPEDVERVADLATLTGIVSFGEKGAGRTGMLVTRDSPRAPVSESYRGLRTAITFANVDKPARTIAVTSANPGEGKSITASNLAVVMAQAGRRVLLIDADLRRPTQHQIFDVTSNNVGLTNLLLKMLLQPSGEADLSSVPDLLEGTIHETLQPGLFLLTSGPLPPNPAELAGSEKLQKLLEVLESYFDTIILDSPPTLVVTDAVVLATRTDGVIFVVKAGSTKRNELQQAISRLQEVDATILGVVLNQLKPQVGSQYYAYYSRAYDQSQSASKDAREVSGVIGLKGETGQG